MASKNLDDVSEKLILGQLTAFLAHFRPKNLFFLRYTPITPLFGLGRTRLNGIITSPHPEVTLDNFGFLVGGCSAARRAVFRPPGRFRLPVTALALSARRPFRPARFARGLDKFIIVHKFSHKLLYKTNSTRTCYN